ncbi:MAG TPA: glucose-6-phosphate dehydrogenase assembly protein OpcA [Pyrinomonadaceae bacterium]|nr:glucose-6-phosphate dehydrogenase assembly protein OpcA [Pyrinomonadaceae bacterium]
MQIQLEKTLDVEVVERELAQLWTESARDPNADTEAAVLRARVANLLVFISSEVALDDVHQMLRELTAIHPSRVLLMLGAREATDQDIDMFVESICQTDKRGGIRLSCEEITLKATGKFVAELPSAALPLLVPDLATFLWWQHHLRVSDKVLDTLLRATDRLIVDSADFADPLNELLEMNNLYAQDEFDHVGISDLNWARLTFWRGLLADYYDVPAYQPFLNSIYHVRVDYVGPERAPNTLAPQVLLIAGWLASRLQWQLSEEQPVDANDQTTYFTFKSHDGRAIKLELNRVKRGEHKPGRLVRVELGAGSDESGARPASFVVSRSEDNLHLVTEARLGPTSHRGRVLPVRNRSSAQLLSREMEILCNDQIYQEAVAIAARMIDLLPT